jgi:hypothetical protein
MIVTAASLCLLILTGAVYDTARLLSPGRSRRPPLPLREQRRVLETAERRLVRQRMRGRIKATTYRARMRLLADGQRGRA